MAVGYRAGRASAVPAAPLGVAAAGALAVPGVLARLGSDRAGLTAAEAARRLRAHGANAVRSHRARAFPVRGRQLRSPVLVLLVVTACASFFVGERGDAVITGVILLAAAGLGFVNGYRAEKAAEALHSGVRHRCVVLRSGHPRSADVTELVPGAVAGLQLGEVVPAGVRLLATAGWSARSRGRPANRCPRRNPRRPCPPGRRRRS
ncbi:MAG TPA: cation-transporting P-type ATPase [Trebonia sp.]